MVPRDVALKFGVVSATALISGLTEDATISTVSGDVVVDGVYGDLQLNTVSGEIGGAQPLRQDPRQHRQRRHHGERRGHGVPRPTA